ncbi:MAG: DUF4224 domain-containing protein [Betaproteobacteria bacterium]|nr:DUF4224 domain-containing protein [Betaproteobacteria bacterium]
MIEFMTRENIAALTGRRSRARQIIALRNMGIQFYINDRGYPVVPETAITGAKPAAPEPQKWQPAVVCK